MFIVFILFQFQIVTANGQILHQNIYPGLENQELLDSLVRNYKSFSLLPYSTCRDTLFAKIDVVRDSLECIYTGMKRYLPPGVDPTDAVLLNGQPNGINTEHTYPQSKGAEGYGRSDMHILYPARVKANSVRVNNPFGEIPDNQTQTWFYLTQELNFPPSVNRDLYSESTSAKFEPREKSKGNIARSMFYFYTFYRSDAVNADPVFFDIQKEDLCAWHYADPVDSVEWKRTMLISQYQGNQNPFVLDCSLAGRLYCDKISDLCALLSTTEQVVSHQNKYFVYPNPGYGVLNIQHEEGEGYFSLSVLNYEGVSVQNHRILSSVNQLNITLHDLSPGLYFLQLTNESNHQKMMIKYLHLGD